MYVPVVGREIPLMVPPPQWYIDPIELPLGLLMPNVAQLVIPPEYVRLTVWLDVPLNVKYTVCPESVLTVVEPFSTIVPRYGLERMYVPDILEESGTEKSV